jgi:hypothetical protein
MIWRIVAAIASFALVFAVIAASFSWLRQRHDFTIFLPTPIGPPPAVDLPYEISVSQTGFSRGFIPWDLHIDRKGHLKAKIWKEAPGTVIEYDIDDEPFSKLHHLLTARDFFELPDEYGSKTQAEMSIIISVRGDDKIKSVVIHDSARLPRDLNQAPDQETLYLVRTFDMFHKLMHREADRILLSEATLKQRFSQFQADAKLPRRGTSSRNP